MTIRLPSEATDEQVLDAARAWVRLAAEDRYEEAMALLHTPPGEDVPTADDVRTLVTNYGSYDPHTRTWRITPVEAARGSPLRPDVDRTVSAPRARAKPGYKGEVWFPVPLNGEWSDLVVKFDVREVDGALVLTLGDVDVP
jgi:hypothetical protein